MEITKDEWLTALTALQDRQLRVLSEVQMTVAAQMQQALREVNADQAPPSPEEVAAQKAERDKNRRDAFACNAMQALLSNPKAGGEWSDQADTVAESAYEYADAMLRARDA